MAYQAIEAKSRTGWFERSPRLLWVLATGFGYIGGSYFVDLVSQARPLIADTPSLWFSSILSIAVTGAIVGLAQGLVLWKYMQIPILGAWVVATVIGSALAALALLTSTTLYIHIAVAMSFVPCGSTLFLLIPATLLGGVVGYTQRRVLEIYLDDPPRWVRISILAAVVALVPLAIGVVWIFILFAGLGGLGIPGNWLLPLLVGWLPPFLYGMVTSGAAARFMRESRAFNQSESNGALSSGAD